MSDSLFINAIKEQQVVQTSEMSTNAKIAAEAVASDGTEATEQNEAKIASNSTELSKSEASVSLEKEMEVDQTSERAVEAASDETEATEQEMDVDQTRKMAAEVASEGTEATGQKIQQMQLAEDPHDLAMEELMEGTDDNEEQLKLPAVPGKAINKKASKSTELNKNEASGSREKVSEEAPANAMDIKNIVVKEEPIEYEL